MKEFKKHYEGINAISDCLRDLEKMADVCTLIGGNTYPQTDLVIETPRIINDYYKTAHSDQTSYFFLGFSKSGCEGSNILNYVQGLFGKKLFSVKLTLKYTDVTMEVKAEI